MIRSAERRGAARADRPRPLPGRGGGRDPRPLRGVRRRRAARARSPAWCASSWPGRRRTSSGTPCGSSPGRSTLDDDAEPDVTIAADIVDFVRLVTGQSNAALLYLGGHLHIDGDAMLALAVGSVFTVPGSDQAAVDPRALDPVDVATAVATTSGKHMRSVMEGGFRPIVLEEVFRRFPDFIDAEKAGDLRLSVGFRIGGSQGRGGRPLRRARRRRGLHHRDQSAGGPAPRRHDHRRGRRLPAARDRSAAPGPRRAHRRAQGEGRPRQGAGAERGDGAAAAPQD